MSDSNRGRIDLFVRGLLCSGLAVGLFFHCRHFWPFLSDDALISLRYARRLVQGHGLTWTGAEYVEGYTDLLWVLVHAAAGALGFDYIVAARSLGVLGVVAAVFAASSRTRPHIQLETSRLLSGGVAVVSTAPFAVWAIGGLEHGFMIGLLAWSVLLLSDMLTHRRAPRGRWVLGVLLGALTLCRADGFVLVGAAGSVALFTWLRREARLVDIVVAFGIPLGAYLLQLVFRLAYYGEWVPNTAIAKVAFNYDRLVLGWTHVRQGGTAASALLLVALLTIPLAGRSLRLAEWLTPWMMCAAWSSYLVVVGGDIFPGWRQLALGLAPLPVLVSHLGRSMPRRHPLLVGIAVLAGAGALLLHLRLQYQDSENQRADSEMWEWDGYSIGPMLHQAFADRRPLMAVDAAGALPYWSDLQALDMLGLMDHYIARHPPAHFGHGGIGHELGNGEYVWQRKPDLILFCGARGSVRPCFVSGREMLQRRDFYDFYQLVYARGVPGYQGQRAYAEMFVRKQDSTLGIRTDVDGIHIPGYFAASARAAAAELGSNGRLGVPLSSRLVGRVSRVEVPAGTWTLRTNAGSRVQGAFACGGASVVGGRADIFQAERTELVDVVVAAPDEATSSSPHLEWIELVPTASNEASRCPLPPAATPASRLAQEPWPGGYWNHPRNVVFDRHGLTVHLGAVSHALHVELSADNNDVYQLEFRSGPQVFRVETRPCPTPGMCVHSLAVPPEASQVGFESIHLQPNVGDGRYAVGHLMLRD